jgi:succinoglycan biosynthesis protein ExoL
VTTIAFFGHDAGDAAVRRRVRAFREDGLTVIGFMMRRRKPEAWEWDNVDLGETRDGAFIQRAVQVFKGARLAARAREKLERADLIYARNLDMLACAFLAKRECRLATPVIYESLDIHRLLTRNDPVGAAFRMLERALLRRSVGLVVSSPGFLRHHFERRYGAIKSSFLVENRLAPGVDYGARMLTQKALPGISGVRLRIGWIGNLRCKRSLDLLCALADMYPDDVEIRLHGQPSRTEIPVFEPVIEARRNMHYFGRYRAPEDLAAIYRDLDLVWAGDFMEAGTNSVWLLPNRIYEGGYYNVPAIAPAGTETAAWIERHACGFTLPEPLAKTLPELVNNLLANPEPLNERVKRLADLPAETFVQPPGLMSDIVDRVLDRKVAA